MKIVTYYEPLEGSDQSDHRGLIALWEDNWERQGYEPIVLSLADAELHPDYLKMEAQIEKLPSVNRIAYEGACYRRWLAFQEYAALKKKPLLISDYDVFNYGTHSPFQEAFHPLIYKLPSAHILFFSFLHASENCLEGSARMQASVHPKCRNVFAWIVPCLAYADAKGLQYIIDLILKHEPTAFDFLELTRDRTPHCSDQFIITQHAGDSRFMESHQCMEAYFEPGWQRFPISHYPSGRMQIEHKLPRSKFIPNCREGL